MYVNLPIYKSLSQFQSLVWYLGPEEVYVNLPNYNSLPHSEFLSIIYILDPKKWTLNRKETFRYVGPVDEDPYADPENPPDDPNTRYSLFYVWL